MSTSASSIAGTNGEELSRLILHLRSRISSQGAQAGLDRLCASLGPSGSTVLPQDTSKLSAMIRQIRLARIAKSIDHVDQVDQAAREVEKRSISDTEGGEGSSHDRVASHFRSGASRSDVEAQSSTSRLGGSAMAWQPSKAGSAATVEDV